MSASARKHGQNDNEINRKQQKCKFIFSTIGLHKRDQQNKASSSTTLYDLPLEMLDIILQKSYLQWTLNSPTKQRDEDVIRSLISVDVCFYRRIARQRFKKAIWRYLKDFYEENKKYSAICRNNKYFLVETIQPNEEFIDSLVTFGCITEEQRRLIQQQRSKRNKNAELLRLVRSFDDKKFSTFAKCLRQTNQTTVASLVTNGEVLLKVKVTNCGTRCTESMDTQLLHQRMSDLRNRTKPRSHQTDKLINQLRQEDIEILNSQLDRQSVVVWIWCHSQVDLEYIQRLYESNQLRDVLLENIQPSISKMINIDIDQFKKTIVVCPISINFTQRIKLRGNEYVWGVTKMRNEICVLCESFPNTAICVFEDQNPYRLQQKIKIKEIKSPWDIGSSEQENCLYVCDYGKCVWKIKRERDDQHRIIKWLPLDYQPLTLSMSSDGQLLMVNDIPSILMIYGSDAELLRAIQLPGDIEKPIQAVQTSIGNFVILHRFEKKQDDRESGSSGRERVMKWGIDELTRDGQMIIHRFIPSNETQELNEPFYISLDSDDRVFVADSGNGRLIILDSDLKWNRILCPTKEETEETQIPYSSEERKIRVPLRFFYDGEKKQLIVGGIFKKEGHSYLVYGINVYTLSQK